MNIDYIYVIILLLFFNFGVKKYIDFAFKFKIVSIPKKRDSHKLTKPKGAGLVFFIIFIMYILFNLFFREMNDFYYYILFSIPLITVFSFIDDIYDINWKYKILIDIFTSIIILYIFINNIQSIAIINSYNFIIYIFIILILTWFINLINFTDGSDGYLVLFTIFNFLINFLVKSYYEIEFNLFNLLFILTLIIFYYYNFYKSKIFLGDSGSRLIAVIIIINLFYDYFNYNILIFLVWILTLLIILLDTGITLTQRIIINKKVLQEHKDHAYQLLANNIDHKASLIWISLNFLFLIMPSILLYLKDILQYNYIILIVTFIIVYQIIHIKIKYR